MEGGSSSGKKGGKKIGRGFRSPAHVRYTNSARWITNAIRRLKRHIKKQPNDKVAIKALGEKG